MKKNKYLIIIAILFFTIGFAAVSTTLILNGTINIGTHEDDFDVYFSDAILDGTQNLSLISKDRLSINYETANLSKVGDKSILEYEVTNASTQYDANVSVTCTPNETDLYKVIITQDKEIIEARSIGNGSVTVELKKNVLENQQINFTCIITATAGERESESNAILPETDSYVLEGIYTDSTGKAISNANLIFYSEIPRYVTTGSNGEVLVLDLERGKHEVYHVDDTLENIKSMTKEEVINSSLTNTTFYTNSEIITFKNGNAIGNSSMVLYDDYCSSIVNKVYNFDYTGASQEFVVPCSGEYKIELWGSAGRVNTNTIAGSVGKGAYVAGNIILDRSRPLYIFVAGSVFNGGGYGETAGGSATDVRIVDGEWSNFDSLKSRIMVAAGGGGGIYRLHATVRSVGDAGGLVGYNADALIADHSSTTGYSGYGATQTSGGATGVNGFVTFNSMMPGGFGRGGYDYEKRSSSGGGSGYYGGGHGRHPGSTWSGGGGGSSFISGHAGCNAIAENSTSTKIVHTGQPNHYSGLVFTNTKMVDGKGYSWTNVKGAKTNMPTFTGTGTMIGNDNYGGYAKITFLGKK